jgi:hypothetical protein
MNEFLGRKCTNIFGDYTDYFNTITPIVLGFHRLNIFIKKRTLM